MEHEIEIMKLSLEFEISRIKSQMLADVSVKIMEKYDGFVTYSDIEEIAKKARILVYSVFDGKLKEEGGEE
jgi:hypothetical protein